jgi:hypothetical protein
MARQRTGRRTIALALASDEPPERKKIPRKPTALSDVRALIDAMIDQNPAIRTTTIWKRLADDHETTVAYYTLRTYVVSRRATISPLPAGPESMAGPAPETPPGQLHSQERPPASDTQKARAVSSYVCLGDDAAESFVVGVVVAPDDVPADHAGLLGVAGVVGAVQREVPQRCELRLDAV